MNYLQLELEECLEKEKGFSQKLISLAKAQLKDFYLPTAKAEDN